MKHEAERLAAVLARLLDEVARPDADGPALTAARAEWRGAEDALTAVLEAGADPRPYRELLERCATLRRHLAARVAAEAERVGQAVEAVRAHRRSLPPATLPREDRAGASCDLRA